MKKFIINLLAFLLTIFPSCGMLLTPYQSITYEGQTVITEKIMEAIKSKDIDALEDMMSLSLKQTIDELADSIGLLIDSIDGEIIEYTYGGGGYDYDESNYGTRISERTWEIEFNTATKSYSLYINWVVINNRAPKEVGMIGMTLFDSDLFDEDGWVVAKVPVAKK